MENESILQSSQKKEEVRKHTVRKTTKHSKNAHQMIGLYYQAAMQDSQVELETYKQTRQGLDEMYNVVWKQYKEEKRIRQVSFNNDMPYNMTNAKYFLIMVNIVCLILGAGARVGAASWVKTRDGGCNEAFREGHT